MPLFTETPLRLPSESSGGNQQHHGTAQLIPHSRKLHHALRRLGFYHPPQRKAVDKTEAASQILCQEVLF